MVASNLKMNEIPMTISRSDLSRELRRMLDKKIAKSRELVRKYDNDHNDKMADAMDFYADGLEYAYACIKDLDEVYKNAYTVKQSQVNPLED